MNETHVVLSWIWNADGTAGIQALAYGNEADCNSFAATARPVTDNPNEQIVVVPKEVWERGKIERLKEFN